MKHLRKPEWIRKKLFNRSNENNIKSMVHDFNLNTVCQEARCPNQGECYSRGTATFLLLGTLCTRNCAFCNIKQGTGLLAPDRTEPARIARAVKKMGLKYVVLTSVTRDDLEDGGAGIYRQTIEEIKKNDPAITIEVLVPDFQGKKRLIEIVVSADIGVFNHNLETTKNLYPAIRPQADYSRSLKVLETAKELNPALLIKTGIMVGLGEKKEDVIELMNDFKNCGGDIITIGQYLPPGKEYYPVQYYVTPEEFETYREQGISLGIKEVIAGPFVRSSYLAEKILKKSI